MKAPRFTMHTLVALAVVACTVGWFGRDVSAEVATLPESAEAQAIIYKVDEIFHTHPERAEECARLLDGVLEKYPGTRQASLALAYLSYGNQAALKNMAEADQFQERLEKEFPNSLALGELLILRGEVYEKDGRIDKARQAYERAIDILDKYLARTDARIMRRDVTRLLAYLWEQKLDDPAGAVKVLVAADKVFSGLPGQGSVWTYVSEIASAHAGISGVPQPEDLAAGNLPALSADSRSAAMLGALHVRLLARDYAKAGEILASLEANSVHTAHQISVLLFKARLMKDLEPQDVEGRLAVWQQVIDGFSNDPRSVVAYGSRADYFHEKGETEAAIREWNSGAANPNLYPEARGWMAVWVGDAYRDMGRKQEAVEAYQRARVLGAGTASAWRAVARLEGLGINPWPQQ